MSSGEAAQCFRNGSGLAQVFAAKFAVRILQDTLRADKWQAPVKHI